MLPMMRRWSIRGVPIQVTNRAPASVEPGRVTKLARVNDREGCGRSAQVTPTGKQDNSGTSSQ